MDIILDEILNMFPDKIQINLDEVKEFIKGGQFPPHLITALHNNSESYRRKPLIVLWFKNPIYNMCNFQR